MIGAGWMSVQSGSMLGGTISDAGQATSSMISSIAQYYSQSKALDFQLEMEKYKLDGLMEVATLQADSQNEQIGMVKEAQKDMVGLNRNYLKSEEELANARSQQAVVKARIKADDEAAGAIRNKYNYGQPFRRLS